MFMRTTPSAVKLLRLVATNKFCHLALRSDTQFQHYQHPNQLISTMEILFHWYWQGLVSHVIQVTCCAVFFYESATYFNRSIACI